ncbi:Methyltransferase sdnD [Colletotrichum spinosum]|uniref:Methyltransferase sdnD n=1 Tax=Colletotrichum spinosum TaxID=1347390 RepID=A0A4R8QVZ4_9PEZI|nr:Methyltransferase sdnD [Colletotrichum spinosum]
MATQIGGNAQNTEDSDLGSLPANAQLVQLADDLKVYTTSEGEARYIYNEIWADGCYDGAEIPDNPFIVDIGANIGLFTIYMRRKYPLARVLAFEPAPANFLLMRQNLKLADVRTSPPGVVGGVEFHPMAVGAEDGRARLRYYPNLPGNSTLRPEDKEPLRAALQESMTEEFAAACFDVYETVDVRVCTLQSILECREIKRIDLVKIDVEGAELAVLQGIGTLWNRVRNIMVETMESTGVRQEIEALLKQKGFAIKKKSADGLTVIHAYRQNEGKIAADPGGCFNLG